MRRTLACRAPLQQWPVVETRDVHGPAYLAPAPVPSGDSGRCVATTQFCDGPARTAIAALNLYLAGLPLSVVAVGCSAGDSVVAAQLASTRNASAEDDPGSAV